MKNFKKIISLLTFGVMVAVSVLIGFVSTEKFTASAEEPPEPEIIKLEKQFSMTDEERGVEVMLTYTTFVETAGDITIEMTPEHNEETLEKFEKYVKKSIDSADVGEVFYVNMIPSDPENASLSNGSMTFKVKLPKFYKKFRKADNIAVMPFKDYRTTQRVKAVKIDDEGYITFTGNTSAYAYAIIYNGVYKQVILIVAILLAVLGICVWIKIICLRRDNPEYKEKKKQKAIQQKKEQHKVNKRLAQELKREKERITKEKSKSS